MLKQEGGTEPWGDQHHGLDQAGAESFRTSKSRLSPWEAGGGPQWRQLGGGATSRGLWNVELFGVYSKRDEKCWSLWQCPREQRKNFSIKKVLIAEWRRDRTEQGRSSLGHCGLDLGSGAWTEMEGGDGGTWVALTHLGVKVLEIVGGLDGVGWTKRTHWLLAPPGGWGGGNSVCQDLDNFRLGTCVLSNRSAWTLASIQEGRNATDNRRSGPIPLQTWGPDLQCEMVFVRIEHILPKLLGGY